MLGEKHEQSAWNNALTLVQLCITQTKQRRTFESLFIFSQWQPIPLRSHVELIAMVSGTYCVHNSLFIIRSIRRDWPLLRPYQISKSFHSFKIRVCLSNILMISSYFKQCAWPLYAVGSFNPFHILISNWNKIRAKWWNEWTKKHCPQIVLWEHMAGNTESNWCPMYSEFPSKSRCNTGFKEHHCIMQRI